MSVELLLLPGSCFVFPLVVAEVAEELVVVEGPPVVGSLPNGLFELLPGESPNWRRTNMVIAWSDVPLNK